MKLSNDGWWPGSARKPTVREVARWTIGYLVTMAVLSLVLRHSLNLLGSAAIAVVLTLAFGLLWPLMLRS